MTSLAHAIPTSQDLKNEILKRAPKFGVYKAGAEWFPAVYANITYWIPPDLGPGKTATHPVEKGPDGRPLVVRADGTLLIGTRHGFLRDNKGRVTGTGAMPGESVEEIVLFLVEKHGEQGLVYLTGDPAVDEPRKALARKTERQHRRRWAESEREARRKFVENWTKTNPGRIPPPPSATQIQAQEFLDEVADETRQGSEFLCKYNDYETDDWEKYARHMRVAHSQVVTRELPAEAGEEVTPEALEEQRRQKAAAQQAALQEDEDATEPVAEESPAERRLAAAAARQPKKQGKARD